MTTQTMIGIDLAKSVFKVHGASMTGELKFRKKLSRLRLSQVHGGISGSDSGDGGLRQRALLGTGNGQTWP